MTKTTVSRYCVAILDQQNARSQHGLYFLDSVHTMEDVVTKFGISKRMKKALGDRWEIHVSHMPPTASGEPEKHRLKNISGITLSVIKRLEALEEDEEEEIYLQETTIKLPANVPAKDTT